MNQNIGVEIILSEHNIYDVFFIINNDVLAIIS